MSKIQMKNRRSILASAIAITLLAAQAQAQETKPATDTTLDEVVVTGSFLKGTPEDAALPVEVITYEELQNIGRPSNLDLVKTMTEVGQVAGETNRYNAFPVGAATVNLRNLGQRFTTVVFNGRRFPEQFSPAIGRFNNIAWIPNAVIGSVEVLKEGGGVTYGADAVGGVVNYITRKNVEGLEVNADYRYIADTSGDYNADAIWGKKFGRGNAMVSVAYQHRSSLAAWDRDWARVDYLLNNNTQAWGAANNPGSFLFQTRATGSPTAPTPSATYTAISRATATTGTINQFTGTREMGVPGTVRDLNCAQLGGFAGYGAAPNTNPLCYMQQAQFEKLAEESNTYQFYGEFNYDLTDSLRYHGEAMYYRIDLPDIAMHPSDSPLSFPIEGASRQTVAGVGAYYVDGRNPAIADFLSTFTNGYTAAQIGAITGSNPAFANSPGRAVFLSGSWRPFATGGNPLHGAYDPQHNISSVIRTTQQLTGDLPEFWGTKFQWDTALTFNHVQDRKEADDVIIDRLQAALNGFGGASCNGIRAGLAGSTCQWFYPLGNSVPGNYYTGVANPNYVPALANSNDLINWMYVPIWLERNYTLTTLDIVFSGDSGVQLPGGSMQLAAGFQVRYGTERMSLDDLSNRAINPCPTIGVTNCGQVARTGALAYARAGTVLGAAAESYTPTDRRFPVYAMFAEAKLPLLDTVELNLAARGEKFISDQSDRDNQVFVPAVSLRWQALEPLALRFSWGKTFTQVNPPRDDGPINTNGAANATFGVSTGQFQTSDYDNLDVKPMTSKYFDVGAVIDLGDFKSTIDFYDIRIEDFTRTMTVTNILQAIAVPGTTGAATRINCASPLLAPQSGLGGNAYVILANGTSSCTGNPLFSDTTQGINGGASRINFFGGTFQTNSGELHASGIDLNASYAFHNVFGGELRPSIDATYNLKWQLEDFIVGGVNVASGYDGIGYRNQTTSGRIGQAVPEWRAGLTLNYHRDRHNLNVSVRYLPSIIDEDVSQYAANNNNNANIANAAGSTVACGVAGTNLTSPPVPAGAGTGLFGPFCADQNVAILTGQTIKSNVNVDATYRLELEEQLSLSLTISNLLDQDPSFARAAIAYDAGFGSPLGRTYRLAVSKKF